MLHYQCIVVSVHFPPNLEIFGVKFGLKNRVLRKNLSLKKKKILIPLGVPLRRLFTHQKKTKTVFYSK